MRFQNCRLHFHTYTSNGSPLSILKSMQSPPQLKHVVILEKYTRYMLEMNEGHDDKTIRTHFPGAYRTYREHRHNTDALVGCLHAHGVHTTLIQANHVDTQAQLSQAAAMHPNAILSAGGDGTFLEAASLIPADTFTKNVVWIFGINTDPKRSEGRLCLRNSAMQLHKKSKSHISGASNYYIESIIQRLLHGNYEPLCRQRICVSLIDHETDKKTVLANRAVNDVFIAEDGLASALYAEVSFDDGKPTRLKNSGLLICSGTGSGAWMHNMSKLSSENIAKVIETYTKFQCKSVQDQLQIPDWAVLEKSVNASLLFHPSELRLRYFIRDPIQNRVFRSLQQSGMIKKINVAPLSRNTIMVLDGMHFFKVPNHHSIFIEIKPEDAIWTAI